MKIRLPVLLFLLLAFLIVKGQDTPSKKFFLVSVNDKQGFINENGKIVIEPIYEQVRDFADGLAPIKIKEKWGFIDESGKIIIKPQYDEIRWSFHENLASVRVGDKWGYINKKGEFVIEPTLEYGHTFDEGRAVINIGKNSDLRHGIIDSSGKQITAHPFEWSGWSFNESLLNVQVKDKWGFIDRDGKFIITPQFKDAKAFSEGLAAVEFADGKSGFIDKSGKVVIPAQFQECWYFKDGLAVIQKDWKYGYINKKGEVVIKPQFQMAYSFSEGLALIINENQKYGFIDKNGKYIVEPKYDMAWSFDNGLAGVSFGKWEGGLSYHRFPTYNGKWGYIDISGKVIWLPSK